MLEVVGAASVTSGEANLGDPTGSFTSELASPLAKATLLAIAIGAIAANSINIYSGAMAFVTIGIELPAHVARALVTVFFGVAGFLIAWWALPDAAHSYQALLLIIAYWIGPWLGVVFADQYLRRGQPIAPVPLRPVVRELGRSGGLPLRTHRVGSAVLQSGEVRRCRREVPSAAR